MKPEEILRGLGQLFYVDKDEGVVRFLYGEDVSIDEIEQSKGLDGLAQEFKPFIDECL